MKPEDKIYIAGHRGMAGAAIVRRLRALGYSNLIYKTHSELDLAQQAQVKTFFEKEKPDYVFMAAAKVGGIYANNTYPADFIYTNLMIQNNVIYQAYLQGAKKLLFLGSSCIYPKFAPQPIPESALLDGKLEPTNEAYAVAKIAGITLCQSLHKQYGVPFISVMPTNLYGPGDNYHPQNSHVMAALIRKFHEAKKAQAPGVEVWGTGTPLREFLYVEDLADACVLLMQTYSQPDIVNIGTGQDLSIADLAKLIQTIVGFQGSILFNPEKPDGTPRKLLDISKLKALGWEAKTSLEAGIAKSYQDFLNQNP